MSLCPCLDFIYAARSSPAKHADSAPLSPSRLPFPYRTPFPPRKLTCTQFFLGEIRSRSLIPPLFSDLPVGQAEDATVEDVPQINEIYNHSIEHHTANWESEPIDLCARRAWFLDLVGKGYPVFVLRDLEPGRQNGRIMCVGSLGPFNTKSGYSRTVENSIYCSPEYTGRGLGKVMLRALIDWAERHGMHTMIAGIGSETVASLKLHEKFGFVEVARMREVGYKFGSWQDLVYMQLMLDGGDRRAGKSDPRSRSG